MNKREYINHFKTSIFFGKKYNELLDYYGVDKEDKNAKLNKSEYPHLQIVFWARAVSMIVVFFLMYIFRFDSISNGLLRLVIEIPVLVFVVYFMMFTIHYLMCWIILENKEY